MSEEYNFDKICRICCQEGEMITVFKVGIYKKMMACARIQVWKNDGLPAQICKQCAGQLHIAFQFKKLCEKTDAKLRTYLKGLKDKNAQLNSEQTTPRSIFSNNSSSQLQQQQGNQRFECIKVENNQVFIHEVKSEAVVPQQQQQQNQQNQLVTEVTPIATASNLVFVDCEPAVTIDNTYGVPMEPLQLSSYNLQFHSNGLYAVSENIFDTENQPSMNEEEVSTSIPQASQNYSSNNNNNNTTAIIETEEFSCPTCGKVFPTSMKLNRHIKTHDGNLPYRCKICLKGFSHAGNYKVHMRVHNDERPYQCTFCDRASRQYQDLVKHMRTHTGERPHECKICGKGFTTSSNLIAHTRIHTGEKPYVCSICLKTFSQSTELTKHTRSHTGEKSHVCKLCNRGFNGSSMLNVHMRSHTGERPFMCFICHKSFTQNSCLRAHIKRHAPNLDNEYCCLICNDTFSRPLDFNKHLRDHVED